MQIEILKIVIVVVAIVSYVFFYEIFVLAEKRFKGRIFVSCKGNNT